MTDFLRLAPTPTPSAGPPQNSPTGKTAPNAYKKGKLQPKKVKTPTKKIKLGQTHGHNVANIDHPNGSHRYHQPPKRPLGGSPSAQRPPRIF